MKTFSHKIISITTKEPRLLFESGFPANMAEMGVEAGKEIALNLPAVLEFLSQKMIEANDRVRMLKNLEDHSGKFEDMAVRVMDELNEEYKEWLRLLPENGAELIGGTEVNKVALDFGLQLAKEIQSLIEKI